MANLGFSIKRLQIDRANSSIVITLALSAALIIFSVVASRNLLIRRSFQARVIKEKKTVSERLVSNVAAADQLVQSYNKFSSQNPNIIDGSMTGNGDRDGDNARIVLDALPSEYDFPALATSLEKLLSENGFAVTGITGTDDELNQQKPSGTNPLEIPFRITVETNYDGAKKILDILNRSIRPISVNRLSISGNDPASLNVNIDAKTYYAPKKKLEITKKVIQ